MTQPIPRVLIQEQRADGRLPRTQIPRIWGGAGTSPTASKGLLRGLALAAFAVLGTMTWVGSAGAVTRTESCGELSTFGETYILTSDLTLASCETCFVVANDRITIDLGGHTISGPCTDVAGAGPFSAGVTDGGTTRQGTTVKNGKITGFEGGINLGSSTRTVIRNLEVSKNAANGLVLGAQSLVKGCTVESNGQDGINIAGDFSQVQDCTISGNGGTGINALVTRMLVTRNTVGGNVSGIVAGESSTVSFNTSSDNSNFGVWVGIHSRITGNTTSGNGNSGVATDGLSLVSNNISNDNGGGGITCPRFGLEPCISIPNDFDGTRSVLTGNTTNRNVFVGVEAWCPSTVTNNTSTGNGDDYNFNGPGVCQTKNNK
jgi:hypothetical protein